MRKEKLIYKTKQHEHGLAIKVVKSHVRVYGLGTLATPCNITQGRISH